MLSIGKLGTGHHGYYERSVASGAEDYYTGRGEAWGHYLGRGADALDLDGVVEQGHLKHLFAGTHPSGGEQWIKRREPDRKPRTIRLPNGRVVEGKPPIPTAAFDLTFSAPKSVSVLFGLSEGIVRSDIRDGHDAAVRAAFDYLERTACVTRRGAGGNRHIRGEGFVAAAFQHRVSRAGDPQLHTHVLVANAAKAEGRYTALHGALLYREAKTASYLYQAVLRSQLTQRLGVEWGIDPQSPHPEIVGVDRAVRELFSKRSDEIQAQLEQTGNSGHRAATAAALDTRTAKTYVTNGESLHERWIAELDARGIDAPSVLDAIGRAPAQAPILSTTQPIIREVSRTAFAPTGLTANKTTFHRRDIIQIVAQHAPQGASVSQIERLADAILDHARRDIVQLRSNTTPIPEGDSRRADGRILSDHRADTAYTTRELLTAELAIIDSAHQRARDGAAIVKEREVERVLTQRDEHRKLSAEQHQMVTQLTTSGAGVEIVVGLAGAGKTFSLDAAHDAWREAGIDVRGTATALTAAKTLEAETRIPSETIAMLRAWHAHSEETGDTRQLDAAIPKHGVLIVDEAGMTETRDLAFLAQLAAERDTKLVLVGDHHQLPEIGAGGAFRHLVHNLQPERVTQLTTNRRQVEAWERDALGELRAGSVEQAVVTYASQDRIITDTSPERLREQLAADWLDARERGHDTAMIAYTRADVEALNQAARRMLEERGLLGRERVSYGGREWAVGDELIATRNRRQLGLTNGTRGTVQRVGRDGLDIRTPSGQNLHVPRNYLQRGDAAHSYATTGHKTQGMTVNGEAFVLATDHVSREWMYVTMSRATDRSRIYIDTLDHDPTTGHPRTPEQQRDAATLDVYDLALRSDAQMLARDHGRPVDPQHLDRNDLRRAMQRDEALRERLRGPHSPQRSRGYEPPQRGELGRGFR
jgi:conjugative relaxase-like TrwC/TraI family protein